MTKTIQKKSNYKTGVIRFIFAIWIAKILTIAGKLLGKKATSMPGVAAMKICPDVIRRLSSNIEKAIIVVCGTNGKTTTNNLLHDVLTYHGYDVICNTAGANMISGIAALFVQSCNMAGKFRSDYACIELDEASAVKVFEYLTPNCMIITNLFRDQLDRYGEIGTTAGLLKKAIDKVEDVKLILNGDDPITTTFGLNHAHTFYFGVSEEVLPQDIETRESEFCMVCGAKLNYHYFHYSQLGDFYCPTCGYKRPQIDFSVYDVDMENNLTFRISSEKEHEREMSFHYKGFYNIYNVLAIYAAFSVLNIDVSNFNEALANCKPETGRMEEFMFQKPLILNLSKNPAGYNQAIMTLLHDQRKKDVIIIINDNFADGIDISWLWDVDFQKLHDNSVCSLTVAGLRAYDMALRLKYADIRVDCITKDVKQAIINILNTNREVCYVLVSYTALFPTRAILSDIMKANKKGGFDGETNN